MLPRRLAPFLFGLILSGLMSLLVSGIATWRVLGFGAGAAGTWAGAWLTSWLAAWLASWLTAWLVAFPAVLVVAPFARRAVALLVDDA